MRRLELADPMNLTGPFDLGDDGSKVFTFPHLAIENVLILDEHTLPVPVALPEADRAGHRGYRSRDGQDD